MDIDKLAVGLIGAASSGLVYVTGALVNKGRKAEQFDRIQKEVSEQARDIKEIERSVSDKVSMTLFKEEIAEIHGRISRTQREQAESMKELTAKVDGLVKDVNFMSGVMSQIPAKIEELKTIARGV